MGSRIDEPLTMTRSSTTYYYNTDGLGSVLQVLNSSGTIIESYDYDPYGQVTIYNSSLTDITSSGSGIDNPYMFTGRRFDEETGIYHYRARQYDPAIGRFLQRDPIGYYDSMNLFEYVGSNPVNWIDPFGLLSGRWETRKNDLRRKKEARERFREKYGVPYEPPRPIGFVGMVAMGVGWLLWLPLSNLPLPVPDDISEPMLNAGIALMAIGVALLALDQMLNPDPTPYAPLEELPEDPQMCIVPEMCYDDSSSNQCSDDE